MAFASLVVFPDLDSIRAAFPHVDPKYVGNDMAYPAMIKFVPAGWLGVVVASLMGALFSTIAAQLSMGANYVAHDVWKRFVHPSADAHELVAVARWTSIALMVAGALLAPLLADAKAGFDLMVMVGAGTGAVFLLRWFWMRINAWTEIVALGVSIVCAVFLQMVGPHVFALSLAFWQRHGSRRRSSRRPNRRRSSPISVGASARPAVTWGWVSSGRSSSPSQSSRSCGPSARCSKAEGPLMA